MHAKDKFIDREAVIRIYAGSDFFLMPSLYEPFGLAQLEAMKLGCIPVVHGVDGLRSTISDPEIDILEDADAPKEAVHGYGQVGVKMTWMNVPLYREAMGRQVNGEPLNHQENWVIGDCHRKFRMALRRARRILQEPELRAKVMENGMRYVSEEHNWTQIISRYEETHQNRSRHRQAPGGAVVRFHSASGRGSRAKRARRPSRGARFW